MKPILFNTEMVKSLLDGRKTVTRRDPFQMSEEYNRIKGLYRDGKNRLCAIFQSTVPEDPTIEEVHARYQPGDILWVRETWCESLGQAGKYFYRAYAGPRDEMKEYAHSFNRWRPSIHMPREAARIFLRVKDVRVERLQDMRLKDCEKEGVQLNFIENGDLVMGPIRAREQFSGVWDSTIKPKDRPTYGWAANPWVWVIDFERISKEEALKDGSTTD